MNEFPSFPALEKRQTLARQQTSPNVRSHRPRGLFTRLVRLWNFLLRFRRDLTTLAVTAIVVGLVVFWQASRLDPVLQDPYAGFDIWFQGDVPRVFLNETVRFTDHRRTGVHPLYSLIAYSAVQILQQVLHLLPFTAVLLFHAIIAALWTSAMYLTVRLLGCRSVDALLFTTLGVTSAAGLFWFVVPETYSLGSLSILMVLGVVTLSERRHVGSIVYLCTSIGSLSITITNWMIGIVATWVQRSRLHAIAILSATLVIVAMLAIVQQQFFPMSRLFYSVPIEETEYLLLPQAGGPWAVARSFFWHTIVMPRFAPFCSSCSVSEEQIPQVDTSAHPARRPCFKSVSMNTQPSVLGSGGGWGMIATGLWTALLGLGSWAMLTVTTLRPLRMVLGLSLSGQLLLHILYGGETFLYSLHFVPLLILPVALSCITPARIFARSLTVLLILTAGVNNIHQLHLAQVRLGEYGAIWQHYGSKSVECPVPLLRWVAEPEKISL